jgi:hypothetical protein
MWPFIHMMPEETVQAAVDLNAKPIAGSLGKVHVSICMHG